MDNDIAIRQAIQAQVFTQERAMSLHGFDAVDHQSGRELVGQDYVVAKRCPDVYKTPCTGSLLISSVKTYSSSGS